MWKLNKINNENPYAVVLHIENTGYGVIRSLANLGIPIMAFQKDTKRPESKTRLCEKTNFDFNNFNELLSKLIEFSEKCTQKPVLYITSDLYIEFVLDNRDIIDKYYILNYPSNEVIRMLLNKDKFYNYSLEHNLPVPKTYYIQSKEDVNYKIQNFEFPVILKPNYFNKNWGANDLAKTYIINNMDELKYIYTMVSKTQSNVLIQDYIPGPDSNFEYCLIYFNDKSECISSFTGQKIRQWPIGLGSLSITKPTKN
jgi:D-aspartate ligase